MGPDEEYEIRLSMILSHPHALFRHVSMPWFALLGLLSAFCPIFVAGPSGLVFACYGVFWTILKFAFTCDTHSTTWRRALFFGFLFWGFLGGAWYQL